jgi:hypothetical protein
MRLALFLLAALLPAQTYVRVSKANPRYLETTDGKPFIPNGPNIGWERYATGEEEVFLLTENRFRALARNGGNFARIFLGAPFYQLDPVTPGVVDDAQLRRIDRLVALARKHGVRLKMCLEHFRTVQYDPPQFKGSVPMGAPHYGKVYSGMTDYFRRGKPAFLAKLDALAERYAKEPAIFGWELWNEINSARQPGWEEWTRDMLPELKKRFPNHLAMQSLGSFDTEAKSEMYRRVSSMPGNEIAQVHRYVDLGATLDVCRGPMDLLAAEATARLLSYSPDRPVIVSEVGAVEPRHAGPFKLYAKDREGILLHDGLFAPFFSGSAAAGQFWHWQDYIEPNNLWWQFARFAEAVKGLDPRAEQFEPKRIDQPDVRVYELAGKKATLLWVRDAASDWRSELQQDRPAQTLRGVRVPFPHAQARVYDPWTNKWTRVKVRGGYVTLPDFRRSVVVR